MLAVFLIIRLYFCTCVMTIKMSIIINRPVHPPQGAPPVPSPCVGTVGHIHNINSCISPSGLFL